MEKILQQLLDGQQQILARLDRIEARLEITEQQQDIIKGDLAFLVKKVVEQDEAMYRMQRAKAK